jgi:glycogen synthase
MRVLMLSWEYPPHVVGGLGKHVADLVPALARNHVEVHLVTPLVDDSPILEVVEGATVYRQRAATAGMTYASFYAEAQEANLALAAACETVIAHNGPFDLIHNHDWLTSFAAVSLKHQHKLPLVATIHATERGRGQGSLKGAPAQRINDTEWRLTYEAWRVICCAHYMAREIGGYFGTPPDKLDVIPNGVDPTPFEALEGLDLRAFRAQYAFGEEKLVLHVGRLVSEKGVEVLIRSVPQVLAEVPEAKFVIAGRGPELERMRQLVREMGLAHKVALPGFISDEDRNKLYKVADCAVFPSLYEPFGIVALEAMAARTPVVVSEVGGLREVVRHAETGITIYPNSPASCAWGIVHTLQHPAWARQRVENAYRELVTVYNWDVIARQTAEVYARVVAERARTAW